MQILKSFGNWSPAAEGPMVTHPDGRKFPSLINGEGRNEASFSLVAVGDNPDEVEHLKSLTGEDATTVVSFEGGALKITTTFKRAVTLEEQAKLKVEADAKAAADNAEKAKADATEAAAKQRADAIEAAAQAKADQQLINDRAMEIIASRKKK